MNRFLIRIVAALLVPRLVMDPVTVMASIHPLQSIHISGRHGGLPLQWFTSQALATRVNTIDGSIKAKDFRLTATTGGLAPTGPARIFSRSDDGIALKERRHHYDYIDTPLAEVSSRLMPQGQDLVERILQLRERHQRSALAGRPFTVFEWGCGDGTNLFELADRLHQAGVDDVRLVGLSHVRFEKWNQARYPIIFINDGALQLPHYLSEGEIDFLVSVRGTMHLEPMETIVLPRQASADLMAAVELFLFPPAAVLKMVLENTPFGRNVNELQRRMNSIGLEINRRDISGGNSHVTQAATRLIGHGA